MPIAHADGVEDNGQICDVSWPSNSILRKLRALVLVEVDLLRERFVANIGTARDLAREVPTGPTGLVKSALKILEDLPPPIPTYPFSPPPPLALRLLRAWGERMGWGWAVLSYGSANALLGC